MEEQNAKELAQEDAIQTEAIRLFDSYCKSSGMDDDDVRATAWHKAGVLEIIEHILEEQQPTPHNIEHVLNSEL